MSWFSNFFKTSSQRAHDVIAGLLDHVQQQQVTIQKQAEVIAAPAVQAVINAPATAQIATGSTISPPTPSQPIPPAVAAPYAGPYPATHNWGDWRDVKEGESPDAYYARTHLGGYGKTTAQIYAEQQAALAASPLGQALAAERYNGPVAFTAMSDADKAFLMYASRNYACGPLVWPAIGSGTLDEMNKAIADGDRLSGHGGYDPTSYKGQMLGLVDAVSKGMLKPSVTA
jgi:hypothetical protein